MSPATTRRQLGRTLAIICLCIASLVYSVSRIVQVRRESGANFSVIDAQGHRSKIHRLNGKQYLWALGPLDPKDNLSEWFDLTGSPLPLEEFEHGIGRDRIAAIDHPISVQLSEIANHATAVHSEGDQVIGYAHGDEARAYPIRLMNRCELVNDTVGGKPVTVGW